MPGALNLNSNFDSNLAQPHFLAVPWRMPVQRAGDADDPDGGGGAVDMDAAAAELVEALGREGGGWVVHCIPKGGGATRRGEGVGNVGVTATTVIEALEAAGEPSKRCALDVICQSGKCVQSCCSAGPGGKDEC